MAILKIKQLEEKMRNGTQDITAPVADLATLATLATSAGKAGSAAYAGTSISATATDTTVQGIANFNFGTNVITPGSLTLGTTTGFAMTAGINYVQNGQLGSCAATDNMFLPAGTQGTNTIVKYLVYVDAAGTVATCGLAGDSVDKGAYSSAGAAEDAAELPDYPDGASVLGYVTLNAPAATKLVLCDGATTAAASLGYILGTGGTAGTATYYNLISMPYSG